MTITINGSGTIAGITAGGLPDATITQPDLAAGVAGNGPAFSAYGTALQSVANVTYTKIAFNTKEFDTASCYDNTTNYRFTPNVAGYYLITANIAASGSTTGGMYVSIYKNGSQLSVSGVTNTVSGTNTYPQNTAVAYANGTTDYFEVYAWNNNGPLNMGSNGSNVKFQACLVRAA